MQKDIRLHGQLANGIEYFVLVVGNDAYQRYFFNIVQEADELRIFSPGNELVLGQHGIRFEGNGGHFCEYMFGVDQPASDLTKPDIINRLVMNGAIVEEEVGTLHFSEHTNGFESYDAIFFDGNAVCNYFFSVHSPRLSRKLGEQQQELVRLLGKTIKRTLAIGEERDDLLVDELYPLLQDSAAQLFIVKLINTHHKAYRDLFRSLYFRSKKIADDDFSNLMNLANSRQIDRYQQERMRIDVMYRHPVNRRIVDEYRSILISCTARGEISTLENARLNRLKALSVRNKIPGALFFTLDELLKKGRDLKEAGVEADCIANTRQILEGFFLNQRQIDSSIDRDDMLALIKAKKWAIAARDHHFDQLMLDFSRDCDEKIRDGADPALLEGFSYVITYLDRLDSTLSLIGQLAFMENIRITEEMLYGLLEHRTAFENLQPGCFEELFAKDLFDNPYLGRFGRLKMTMLLEGLPKVQDEKLTLEELHRQLNEIDQDERIYLMVLELVRHRIRHFYSSYGTKSEQDVLRREVMEELKARKKLAAEVPEHIFQQTVATIQKEAMYLQSLLPSIIAEKNAALREDFLANAGLDRFYVEELEREYYEENGLDLEEMYQIRQGL
jgi:uncharacterized protein (TIGR04442 family)